MKLAFVIVLAAAWYVPSILLILAVDASVGFTYWLVVGTILTGAWLLWDAMVRRSRSDSPR